MRKLRSQGGHGVRWPSFLALGALVASWGCATAGPPVLGPRDVPDLERRALAEPNNGRVQLELAAALAASGRCYDALAAAERGRRLEPADPLGPLVTGQCLEDADLPGHALEIYGSFLSQYGNVPGAAAVEGRRAIALQAHAKELVRAAIQEEEALEPADPETVGVLPFLVAGDSVYQPLSVGLAHMLTTDLASLGRFPLVERVRLGAVLEELALSPETVDPSAALRSGRLVGAARMVLGTVSIPTSLDARLGGNVVLETGEVVEPTLTEGELTALLDLQKEYSARVAEALGYGLTEEDRRRMEENRPANLRALLAFSRGLMAEDAGDFAGAAAHFQDALSADPQYGDAQQRFRSAVGADVVSRSGRGEVVQVASRVDQALGLPSQPTPTTPPPSPPPTSGLLQSTLGGAVFDVASHQAERSLVDAGSATPAGSVTPSENQVVPPLEAILTIIITIPR
jgi:tetratricopeptide (TPR) repeat protein